MKWLKLTLLWCSLVGLAFLLFEGAAVEYHRYENEGGFGRDRSEYVGENLGDSVRDGIAHTYRGAVRRLENRPEGRTLLVIALGWLGIVHSVRWVERG